MIKNFINKYIRFVPWVIFSALVQAFVNTTFSVPGNLYSSGVLGLSRITSDILIDFFKINIPYTIFYFGINIVLVFFVFKKIGKVFTVLSLTQVLLVSLLSSVLKPIYIVDDVLLLAVFGGIINGFANSLALTHNASTGGADFLSIYYSSKYNKSMWNILFLCNSIIIIASGIIYTPERALYSIIFQFCSTQIVNRLHKRYTSQTITIITVKPKEVADEIFSTIRHGITEIEATGLYKNTKTHMLYTVINSYQTDGVVNAIKKADPSAFINIQDTKLVIGNYYQKPLD